MSYSLTLSHVGIHVTDMARMVDFYTRYLGFAVSDRGKTSNDHDITFMTRDPREHHQLVLAGGRPANLAYNPINQLSFRVDRLGTLRELHAGLASEPVGNIVQVCHGNALSVYFMDPEKNRVELLIDTPWYIPQPHRAPADLSLADDELWSRIEQHCRAIPGFKPRVEWAAEMEQKITQAGARRQTAKRLENAVT